MERKKITRNEYHKLCHRSFIRLLKENKAFGNYKYNRHKIGLNHIPNISFKYLLIWSFSFHNTKEGFQFWRDISKKCEVMHNTIFTNIKLM